MKIFKFVIAIIPPTFFLFKGKPNFLLPLFYLNVNLFRGNVQKKTSIFVDIVHTGGREVNPMSKN